MSQLVRQISPPPLVRTSQPQCAVGIDWGNPITRGLVIAENHSNPRFAAFNSPTQKVGPSYRGTGGVATRFVSASSQYLKQSNTSLTNYPLTFLSVFQRATRPFDGVLMGIGAGTNRHILYANQDNIACFSGAGGTSAQAASTGFDLGSFGAGDVRCAVGVISAANSRSVYLDGTLVGTNVTTVSTGASNTAVIGCYWNNDAPSLYFNGDIYLSLAWNRALTDTEIKSLSQNPWQIFKPIARPYPFDLVRGPVQTRQSRMLGTSDGAAASVAPAVLGLRSVFTQQPQQAVDIDWSYDPVFVWSGIRPNADLAKQLPVTVSASAVRVIGKSGVAYDLGTNASSLLNIAGAVSPGANFTAVVQFQNTSETTNGILLAGKTHWTQENGFMFCSKNNTDTLELNGGSGGTFTTISAPGVGALDGKIRTVAVRCRGTSADVCMDGRFLGTVSLGFAAGIWPSGIGIGNYSAPISPDNPPARQFYMAAVVRKGDPVSISANPWQIFRPLNRQIWVAA